METAGERDGAWRKKTVNEAFLGSSKGLSRKGGENLWAFFFFFFKPNDLTRKTARDLSLIQGEKGEDSGEQNINQASTTVCRC